MKDFVEGVEQVGAEEVVEVHQAVVGVESGEQPDYSTDLLHTQIARGVKILKNIL